MGIDGQVVHPSGEAAEAVPLVGGHLVVAGEDGLAEPVEHAGQFLALAAGHLDEFRAVAGDVVLEGAVEAFQGLAQGLDLAGDRPDVDRPGAQQEHHEQNQAAWPSPSSSG